MNPTEKPTLPIDPPSSPPEEEHFELTRGWVVVGVTAVALGIAMGFIMGSVWLVP